MAMMFAASHPDRVPALVLVNTFARWRRADDYPIGMPDATSGKAHRPLRAELGRHERDPRPHGPSVAHDPVHQLVHPLSAAGMPRGAATMYRWVTNLDVRSILPAIRVPTLVVQRADARHRPQFGRYLAENIAGAKYVELPGADTFPFNRRLHAVAGRGRGVLDGSGRGPCSTASSPPSSHRHRGLDEAGGRARRRRVEHARPRARRVVREHLRVPRPEVDHTGDGFLATFDGPARAVTCALRLQEALSERGIAIRAGVHTGEVELAEGTLRGLAVHIAARVMAAARDGGILVSSTVHDLVVGSGSSSPTAERTSSRASPGVGRSSKSPPRPDRTGPAGAPNQRRPQAPDPAPNRKEPHTMRMLVLAIVGIAVAAAVLSVRALAPRRARRRATARRR